MWLNYTQIHLSAGAAKKTNLASNEALDGLGLVDAHAVGLQHRDLPEQESAGSLVRIELGAHILSIDQGIWVALVLEGEACRMSDA